MLIRLYISLLSGAVFLAALMLVADSTDRIWQVGRASGVAAFVIMTMAVCFGLIQSSKALIKIRIMLQPTALEIHRSLTWAGLTLVGVHAVTLLLIMGYTLTYTVGLGILAACLIVLLIITSELRNKIVSLNNKNKWLVTNYYFDQNIKEDELIKAFDDETAILDKDADQIIKEYEDMRLKEEEFRSLLVDEEVGGMKSLFERYKSCHKCVDVKRRTGDRYAYFGNGL